MDGTLRSLRLPAAVLLLLCVLPLRVDAQQFICRPIAAGDTASSLARRLTGKTDGAYGHAFQIRDPARRMFVPKSQYQHLHSNWQACVAREPVSNTPVAYAPVVEVAAWAMVRDEPTIAPTPEAIVSAPVMPAGADRPRSDGLYAMAIGAGVLSLMLLSAVAALISSGRGALG